MINDEKQRLRARIRALARGCSGGNSSDILASLGGLPAWKKARTVLLYSPLPGEPDPLPLISEEMRRGGGSLLFPRIEGDHLGLYRYVEGIPWREGPHGLKEPDPGTWQGASIAEVDLALVPGLAFDPLGGRLGRGRGFYDRLLGNPAFRGLKIGLCWDWQVVELVPMAAHDAPMDLVVTEGGIRGSAASNPATPVLDNPSQRG